MHTILRHKHLLKPPIKAGSRIIKTAVAVMFSYLITELLHTPTPIHAIVAVIITMQPTIYETVSTSKNRIWGTIIGLLIGSIYLLFIPTNAITLGIGVFITLTLCTHFGWGAACGISCFAFTALIIQKDASIVDGFYRLIDTGIGVMSSLIINFLTPNRSCDKTLEQQLTQIKKDLFAYLLMNLECYITLENKENLNYQHTNLQISFERAKEKYEKYELECKYRHYSFEKLNEYNKLYHNLWSVFILIDQIHLDIINGQRVHNNLYSIFSECFKKLKELKELLDETETMTIQDIQTQLNALINQLQTDLLDIEKIGIDGYKLSRHEKREVLNKLYLLDRILHLAQVIL